MFWKGKLQFYFSSLVVVGVLAAVPSLTLARAVKMELCHVPEDTPTNLRHISVGGPALNAHLGHGDHVYSEVESCNGLDDNCDGSLADGEPFVVTGDEGICNDGLDNDCDGLIDDEDSDCLQVDPQCLEPYTSLTLADRSINFNDGNSGIEFCDDTNYNFDAEWAGTGWYRITGDAGNQIPESSPSIYSCGTDAPGWLNGTHPDVEDGAVPMQVCFNWSGNQCRWAASIEVVNCGGFFLYHLPDTPVCSLRYCGVDIPD